MAPRCQFHQCFYIQIFRTNVVSAAFSSYVLAMAKIKIVQKMCELNIDEIDGRLKNAILVFQIRRFGGRAVKKISVNPNEINCFFEVKKLNTKMVALFGVSGNEVLSD